jgi:hypothetical protein
MPMYKLEETSSLHLHCAHLHFQQHNQYSQD